MGPLSKETLEVGNFAGESTASQSGAPSKFASGHLRSDAVSLEIPVKVHGSCVTEVVPGATPHTEPFEEQATTMIVFPQGAVLRMSTSVNVGQMLVVTNLKSRQDAICRVLKVRTFSNIHGYVEIEFTNRQPGYWGVTFPSDGSTIASKVTPPAPAVTAKADVKEASAPDVSWAPTPAPSIAAPEPLDRDAHSKETTSVSALAGPVIPAAKPISSFAATREDVLPTASATVVTKENSSAARMDALVSDSAQDSVKTELALAPHPVSSASLALAELRGDDRAVLSASMSATEAPETHEEPRVSALAEFPKGSTGAGGVFGSFESGAIPSSSYSASGLFGARLESSIGASAREEPRRNWVLIAACLAVLFAGVAAGIFYFRQQPVSGSAPGASPVATTQQPAVQQAAQPLETAPGQSSEVQEAKPSSDLNPDSLTRAKAASENSVPADANSIKGSKPASVSQGQTQSSAPEKVSAPKVTSNMLSATLNVHPVASRRADDGRTAAAPSLDAGAVSANENLALPVVPSSPSVDAPPPPEIKPEGPVRVGGQVKMPRLISSAAPVYPMLAKETNVQGDVVIRAVIDKSGNVSQMEVVSGPPLLRQAALNALRTWKYEPSMLNGEPASVQVLVTIRFRR